MKKAHNIPILFVINPTSGRGNDTSYKADIDSLAEKYGFIHRLYYTTGKNDPEEINRHIGEFKPHTVVGMGGDGTITMVATQLIGKDIRFGIIPAGSANGLAFNLNLTDKFREAVINILHGDARPMDVIRINKEHYCLHLSDLGLNARVVKRFEEKGSSGIMGYARHLIKEMTAHAKPFSVEITTPDCQKKSKAEMLVIANASSFGTGAEINPDGKLDDGKFEIVMIKPYPWWAIFRFTFYLFIGKFHKLQFVRRISTQKATIQLSEPLDMQIDGEPLEDIQFIEAEIIPGALRVVY